VRCHQLVFHEAGHYSHARQAGQVFWAKNMAATISNSIASLSTQNASPFIGGSDPYRDGSQPSFTAASRISLVEGWGNLTEFKITNFYYGKSFTNAAGRRRFVDANARGTAISIESIMENFDMYQRPMNVRRRDDRSWFMHGLMWDLIDNRNEIETFLGSGDNLSNYLLGDGTRVIWDIQDPVVLDPFSNPDDLGPVYRALGNQTEDGCDFYWRLVGQNPNQRIPLRTLFGSYGFDCENLL
jgi:hypothetical protein